VTGDVAVEPLCHVADAAASPSRIDPGNVRTEPDTRSHLRVTATHWPPAVPSLSKVCFSLHRGIFVGKGGRPLVGLARLVERVTTGTHPAGTPRTSMQPNSHRRWLSRTAPEPYYDMCAEPRSMVRRRRRASPCEAGGRVVRRRQSDAWIMLSPRFTSTNQSSSLQPFSQLRTTLMRALTVSC